LVFKKLIFFVESKVSSLNMQHNGELSIFLLPTALNIGGAKELVVLL